MGAGGVGRGGGARSDRDGVTGGLDGWRCRRMPHSQCVVTAVTLKPSLMQGTWSSCSLPTAGGRGSGGGGFKGKAGGIKASG